jgi:hypothetical protein
MESFGGSVDWEPDTATAIVRKDTTTVRCKIGENCIYRNNVKIENDAAAVIVGGRTYLPIRAVLEAFGAGNIPNDRDLEAILARARENGVVLTVCSQCNNGKVRIGTYAASMYLKRAGAVSGLDMTTEAAVTKLYYLFSKYDDIEKIKELMETDLRGEITTAHDSE